MPELTPKQLREIEEMNAILASTQMQERMTQDKNFGGSVESAMDVDNAALSVKALDAPDLTVETATATETVVAEEEEEVSEEVKNLLSNLSWEMPKTEEDDTPIPLKTKQMLKDEERSKQIKEQNKKTKIAGYTEIERLYYDNLDETSFKAKESLLEEIQEIEANEDNYNIMTYQTKTGDGMQLRRRKSMSTEARAKMQEARDKYQEIIRPVNEKYLEIINNRIEVLNKVSEFNEDGVAIIADSASTGMQLIYDVENKKIAERFLNKAKRRVEDNLSGAGAWGAMLSEAQDPDFYSVGLQATSDAITMLGIIIRDELGYEPTESEVAILDAVNTNNDAQTQVDTNQAHSTLTNVMQTLPWMAQMAATAGIGSTVEKGARMAIYKGINKHTQKIMKTGIKASTLAAIKKGGAKGLGYTVGAVAQVLTMPSTHGDAMERYIGEVEIERDIEGNFVKAYVRDELYQKVLADAEKSISMLKKNGNNYDSQGKLKPEVIDNIYGLRQVAEHVRPVGGLEAGYKATTNAALELFTERVVGKQISKVINKTGLGRFTKLPEGKYSDLFRDLKRTFGYDGLIPEMLEEEAMIPLNSLFVGDSKYSDLWDAHQQEELFLQVAVTGILMGGFGQVMNLPSRLANQQYYKDRKLMLRKFQELKDANPENIASLIDLASSASEITSLVQMQEKLRKEGKHKEADIISEKLMTNQMLQAFDTHTIDDFENAMNSLAKNSNLPDNVKANIQKAQVDIIAMKEVYERFQGKKNLSTIMRLQANKMMSQKATGELETQLSSISEDMKADVEAHAKKHKIKIPEGISLDQLYSIEYEDSLDKETLTEYNQFLDKLDVQGIASLGAYQRIQMAKNVATTFNRESRILFNEQTSLSFEIKTQDEAELNKAINNSTALGEAIIKNDEVTYNKEFEKIVKANKGTLSSKKIAEIKSKLDDKVSKAKAKEQIRKQKDINAKAEAIAKAAEEAGKPNAKVKEIEAKISDQREEVKAQEKEKMSSEQLKLNEEFKKEADGLQFAFTPESHEDLDPTINKETEHTAAENDELGFDLPRELSQNLTEPQKELFKSRIAGMYEILKKELGHIPTFKDLVTKYANSESHQQAEEYYNVLVLGWRLNEYAEISPNIEYNKIFDPFKVLSQELSVDKSIFADENTEKTAKEKDQKASDKINKRTNPVIAHTVDGTPIIRKEGEGLKTITSELKLGFLAMPYITNDKGQRQTVGDDLNDDGLVDFKRLLDPDKFNAGTMLSIGIPDDGILNKTFVNSIDAEGNVTKTPYNKWLEAGLEKNPDFKTSTEYIASVPMFAYDSEGVPVSYVHGTGWYNTSNIGHADNPPLQAKIIQQARKEVLELREKILSGEISQIEIQSKEGVVYHTISEGTPAMTMNEANPDSVVGVAMKRGRIKNGNDYFENKNRVIIGGKKLKSGLVYDLRRIGVNELGQETWFPFEILKQDAEKENKISEDTLNTVKWALAAHLKIAKFPSYLQEKKKNIEAGNRKDPKIMAITELQANDIAKKILDETGFDITVRDGLRSFMRQYIAVSDVNYHTLSTSLFNQEFEVARKEFKNHADTDGMGTDAKMIQISGDGEVSNTDKTYIDTLKDYFKTTVKSFNVGTAENPVWATTTQPKIKFGYKQKPADQIIAEKEREIEKEKEEVIESKETEADKANQLMDNLGLNEHEEDYDLPLEVQDTSALEGVFKTTPGVTIQQEATLVDFLFNRIAAAVGIKGGSTVDKSEVSSELKDEYTKIIKNQRTKILNAFKNVQAQYNAGDKSDNVVETIKRLESALEVYGNIAKNWSSIEDKAFAKMLKYTKIKDDSFQEDLQVSQREKDYSKSSLEEDNKNKTSYRLRRFFAGINERTKDGASKKGFLGLPTFVGFNEVYDSVAQILSSPVETESDFDTMMLKLNEAEASHKWLPDLIQKLEGADEQMKKEFVYNFTKHSLSMKFAMYSMNQRGNYNLKIYDTNSHEISRLIRSTWSNNFKMTPLVIIQDGEYAISKTKAANLSDQFASWGDNIPPIAEAKLWLKQFGINLSEDAFNELVEKGMWYSGDFVTYKSMFVEKDGVFRLLNDYLKTIDKSSDTKFENASDINHPHSDIGGILKTLATIEGKYTNQAMTLSFRDNGKSIFGLTPNKFATDRVLQLKQYDEDGNNELVEQLKKLSMSKDSYVLALLEGEEDFRAKFGIDHIGITSLKELGSNVSPFSGVTDLSDIDHDLTKMAGLQDLKQGKVKSTVNKEGEVKKGGNGISMRIGRMFLPTMSDKSQMLLLNTGVFNFFKDKNKSFEVSSEGEIGFTPTLRKLLFNQIVKPELNRISKFHSEIGSTDITGYDLGAQIFHFIPALNNIKDDSGNRIIELMATRPEVFTAEQIEKDFGPQIDAVLKEIITKKVSAKKKLWDGNTVRDGKGDITKIKFFDDKYLSQTTGSLNEKFDIAMFDFVLNSMLANSNMYTLLAGDPALYSQDKLFNNFEVDNLKIKEVATVYGKEKVFSIYPNYADFIKDVNKLEREGNISEKLATEMKGLKPNPTSGSDVAYLSLSEKIGVNLGKRLALLIAPGSKLANSKGKKYKQIFLKDSYHMAENMEYLVELYHGKEALAKVQSQFDEYRSTTNQAVRNNIRVNLGKKFPDLSEYFDIESTDAQEYSTVAEHINILENQGRIPDAKLKEIRQALKDGKDLTASLLEFVLQPIKPVYTGQILDEAQDVARTIYIKSSSFPLLPQMTKGRKLDALRLKMEELEAETNGREPVRASYQSANKVGSMNNPIDPFNAESLATASESMLTLDRDNFRIQQDVPFKSDKQREDKVSMGTQIFKLLFGDGMLDQDGFEIGESKYTGRKLYEHFNETFASIIKIKKRELYRELGLNEKGLPIDERKSVEKLQQLLQKEAIDKGYPRQDIEGLTFVEKRDTNNQIYYDFKLPLWLSANSNRYESLLNSIVTNRLIKQKLPGSSFVLGSEEGMEMTESKDGIKDSRMILIGDHKGGELRGVQDSEGRFTYAEIYVPSKFKNSKGELIDLYEKKNNQYIYLTETEEGLHLKDDMISEELLTNFTFRTPTSAHVSASIVKIAGIIPPENGDLMVVPKNFIKQKGLDYDVDKETAYQLWSVRGKDGKITALTEAHKKEAIDRASKNPASMEEGTPLGSLLTAIFGAEYTTIMDDSTLNHSQRVEAISDKFDKKLLENEFIRIHKAIYANPNKEVQKKINKVLSMKFASEQADFIEELSNEGRDNSAFTILDDSYQKGKMELGAAGKLAIGVYSNYVTFHSLTQQMDSKEALRLMEEGEDGPTPKFFRIGNFVSDGKIGRLNALGENARSIAEAFAEKQNTATDNEKEQILGRVNINGETINVDAILTLLGFDKGETVGSQETSIPYLFLSQPILKDYVKKMQENKAITSDFVFDAQEKIIAELKQKYSVGYSPDSTIDPMEEFDRLTKEMTSENLINEISAVSENTPGLQIAILEQFMQLNEYARDLSGIQGTINTTSLGKSIIESNDKFDKLESFANNKKIENVDKLIGDYILASSVTERPEGYFKVGKYFVKPMTPQGQIVVNGIVTGNELWNQYFPYSNTDVQAVMKEIMTITNAEEKSDRRKIEIQYEIFREMKKYMNSNSNNGLFTEQAGVEREGLFIDSAENTSLASYLNTLKNTPGKNQESKNKKGAFNVRTSKLISKFQYNLNTNGEPSTIHYNNSASENFDEDYLYNSMAEMVINRESLPDKNGQPYDTRMLAADLVAYAYAEGGVQEVIQFVKYVPIEYLDAIGFNQQMQMYSPKRNSNIFRSALGIKELTPETDNQTHTFVKQYMQHNPDKTFRANNETYYKRFINKKFSKIGDKAKGRLDEFTFNSKDEFPKFISRKESTRSKRKQDKFSLFQHIGNGKYQRISVLGTHGMNEYELGNENMHSLLDKADPVVIRNEQNKKNKNDFKQTNDIFDVKNGNATEILNKIKGYRGINYKHFPKLIDFLLPSVKSNLTVIVKDTTEGGKPRANGRATRDLKTGAITIILDNQLMESNDHSLIARTFIHEFIHSVTLNEIGQYVDKDGKMKKGVDKVPVHISRLVRVFTATKKQLGPELDAFNKKREEHLLGELPSGTGYSARELQVTYAGSSIFEFVTTALTEPAFQEAMKDVKFSKTGQSIFHRFKSAVINILYANNVQAKPDSITFEALSSIMDVIEIEADKQSNNNLTLKYPKQNRYSSKEWREAQALGKEGEGQSDAVTDKINTDLGLFDLPRTLETKKNIDEIFKNKPTLQKIGSKEDYSKFLAYTGGEFRTDVEGFQNYIKGLTGEVLDSLPDICI